MGVIRKPELAQAIDDILHFPRPRTCKLGLGRKIVTIIFDTIYKGLLLDGRVVVAGLGTFYLYTQTERWIYSSFLKKTIYSPEKIKVKFKPSASLMRSLDDK